MTLQSNHAYAELGGFLKERFGLLLTVDECRSLVGVAEGWAVSRDYQRRWRPYGGFSGQPYTGDAK